jgi:hypothetical protein
VSYEGDAGAAVTETQPGQQQGAGAEGVQGGQQQGQQGAGGQQQGGEDPIARLVSSMDGFMRDVGERFDGIEGRLPQQQQAGREAEPEGFDLAAMLEELPDDAFGDDGTITPEGNLELIRQVARAEADAVRSEQQRAALEAEHDSYANGLEQKYTKLADPQVQQQVLAAASQLANRMRQPELAPTPTSSSRCSWLWKLSPTRRRKSPGVRTIAVSGSSSRAAAAVLSAAVPAMGLPCSRGSSTRLAAPGFDWGASGRTFAHSA